MRVLAAFGLSVFLFFTAGAASAQTSAEGADQLKAELQEMFDLYNAVAAKEYGEKVYLVDEIAVSPEGAAYNVLLRNLRMVLSKQETFGVSIGDISAKMAPLGDQLYRVSDFGPLAPVTIYDDSGQAAAQIAFADVKLEGDFSTRYLSYLTLDASAASVEVTPMQEPGLLRSGPFTVKADSKLLSEGRYDQWAASEVRDIAFSEGGDQFLRINRITAASQASDVDLDESAAFMRRLAEAQNPEEVLDLGAIAALIPGIGDSKITIEGFSGDAEGTQVSIGQMIFAGGYESGANDMAKGDFEVSILDIAVTGAEVENAGLDPRLVPSRFTFKSRLDQLPNKEILAFFTEAAAMANAESMGENTDEQSMMAAMTLADGLARSGSSFTIDELSFANQLSALAGTGSFRANPNAAYMVEGFFRMQLAGMPNLQQYAQQLAASQNQQQRETGQGLLGMLGLMMVYAQGPETPPSTVQGALAYDLKVRPDGAITINGTPLLPPQPSQPPQQ